MTSTYDRAKENHSAGNLDLAIELYQATLEADPEEFRALNNLATIHEQLGRKDEAEALYQQALALQPELANIHYNLGHLYQKYGHREQAIECYQTALQKDPEHIAAAYNLGNILFELNRLAEAEIAYRRVLQSNPPQDYPELFKVHSNLGQVLMEFGRVQEAESLFRQAAALNPECHVDYVKLGDCLALLDRYDEAKAEFDKALTIKPQNHAARQGLAQLFRRADQPEHAAAVYEELLELAPNDPVARHLLAACGGSDTPTQASNDYVETVFDSFADSFDRVLDRLQYRAPYLLSAAVAKYLTAAGSLEVLDAGCGTGLCQEWLRPYATRLIGVDLSEKMLDKARERGGYDGLTKAELTEYLGLQSNAYHLIVSADTLVYFGALETVLGNAAQSLQPGGLLAFTVEQLQAENNDSAMPYHLNTHGRYSHSRDYLEHCLTEAGLDLCCIEAEVLRQEQGKPVHGWVVVAIRHAKD